MSNEMWKFQKQNGHLDLALKSSKLCFESTGLKWTKLPVTGKHYWGLVGWQKHYFWRLKRSWETNTLFHFTKAGTYIDSVHSNLFREEK